MRYVSVILSSFLRSLAVWAGPVIVIPFDLCVFLNEQAEIEADHIRRLSFLRFPLANGLSGYLQVPGQRDFGGEPRPLS